MLLKTGNVNFPKPICLSDMCYLNYLSKHGYNSNEIQHTWQISDRHLPRHIICLVSSDPGISEIASSTTWSSKISSFLHQSQAQMLAVSRACLHCTMQNSVEIGDGTCSKCKIRITIQVWCCSQVTVIYLENMLYSQQCLLLENKS